MHNKSFTADNQIAILGGRNIGDEYFQANPAVDFADLDVLTIGPVVQEVSNSFDLYWNCPAAYPISILNKTRVPPDALAKVRAELAAHVETMEDSPFAQSLRQSRLADQITRRDVAFDWGRATLVYDDPAKVAAQSDDPSLRLLPKLRPIADAMQRELLVISPYFVPGRDGVNFFKSLRDRGVRVIILTNSMATTDAVAVHAGYRRYRMELLRMGVELYELKPTATRRASNTVAEGDGRGSSDSGHGGSSSASLHAKTFVFDRQTIFVGSLNLDPRSARINTEVGVVFEGQQLASRLAEGIEPLLADIAWRVEAVPVPGSIWHSVRLNWVTRENGSVVRQTSEPAAGFWRGLVVNLVSLLPVESQL
jgi:cardiolipin synthase C